MLHSHVEVDTFPKYYLIICKKRTRIQFCRLGNNVIISAQNTIKSKEAICIFAERIKKIKKIKIKRILMSRTP